jgi:hypothetical protein
MPLPPKYAALETQINAVIVSLMNQVSDKAEGFLAAHGWYFQGIVTGPLPIDGALVTPDTNNRPSYQLDNWNTYGVSFPAKIPCTVAIDNYYGPLGKDFALRIGVSLDGVPYLKTVAYKGTEAKTTDWTAVPPPPVLVTQAAEEPRRPHRKKR